MATTTAASNSPEFEFWMVRNPSIPPPTLVSADELFVDGILLPLQLLHLPNPTPAADPPQRPLSDAPLSASKRWANLFKKASPAKAPQDKEKSEKKKERKSCQTGPASSAELNINIWPFSRSRSAGNSGARPRMFPGTRKVNSAPCSRSNSSGDSKSRKWPSSPGRPGVHLGRSSPVWQVRRGKNGYPEPGVLANKKESRRSKAEAGRTSEVVNLKGPMCRGNRQQGSCRSDENGGGGSNAGNRSGNVGSGASLFNLRSLFNKKVY